MAYLDEEFSIDSLPQGTSNFDPLPEGWYNASITGAEIKATKMGDGKYIACKYTITGPSHQGRVVFGNLNIKNASTKAEEIGRVARLMELDPKYCDVIVKRWQDFTGKIAVHAETGEPFAEVKV